MAASNQLQVLSAWLSAYSAMDASAVGEFLVDDYTHHVLPASLARPVHTSKEAFLAYLAPMLGMFTAFTVTTKDIVEGIHAIAFHASSTGMSATGAPYANEYMIIVRFREDGAGNTKISVKEFVDSQFSAAFFEAERGRIAKAQAAGSAEAHCTGFSLFYG